MGFGMEAMSLPIKAFGYKIAGVLAVPGKFDAGIIREDADVLHQCAALGKKLADLLGC